MTAAAGRAVQLPAGEDRGALLTPTRATRLRRGRFHEIALGPVVPVTRHPVPDSFCTT